jgi:hypothetical protein
MHLSAGSFSRQLPQRLYSIHQQEMAIRALSSNNRTILTGKKDNLIQCFYRAVIGSKVSYSFGAD